MLSALSIRDIVLIDRVDLQFEPGLCVLTGETGAGKSILLDALGLATGARADKRLVRHGADRGTVTASFSVAADHPAIAILEAAGVDPDPDQPGSILLRRMVGADGPSRAFINDQPVSAGLLQEIGAVLLEIHGQHDDRGLLDPSAHRAFLDAFGGLGKETATVARAFAAWREADEALRARETMIESARGEADYLRHMVKELAELDPQPDEEDRLAAERTLLMHGERIADDLDMAAKALTGDGGLETRISTALRRLEKARDQAAGKLDDAIGALDRTLTEAAEARHALDAATAAFQFDPDRLARAEERLFALRAAARKHNVRVDDLPALRERFEERWAILETGAADLSTLRDRAVAAREAFVAAAGLLSTARRSAAALLDKAVAGELAPLKLDKAHMATAVAPLDPEKGGPGGLDTVRFEVATNPGAPFGPLTQIASGGELSRFILALKVVLAAKGAARTLIFDEIDRGVGGAVAHAVGERLSRLADVPDGQVIVVTHSPQVAARGRHHWMIAKGHGGGSMITRVTPLDAEARREEIARMLAGATVTDEARAAADQLLAGHDDPAPAPATPRKKRARRS